MISSGLIHTHFENWSFVACVTVVILGKSIFCKIKRKCRYIPDFVFFSRLEHTLGYTCMRISLSLSYILRNSSMKAVEYDGLKNSVSNIFWIILIKSGGFVKNLALCIKSVKLGMMVHITRQHFQIWRCRTSALWWQVAPPTLWLTF